MLKDILNLKNAQKLSTAEQKNTQGGIGLCTPFIPCSEGTSWNFHVCECEVINLP
ncbi:hypothetical protein [uncultured Dokdonia sp.]|uniref:hypothetical protein n=1 Tax=uncultured Dokdonia sp. TaxID=575653 RepID=UPI00260977E4|nr:hypothetical protein [uncultured Dokdonia sp.]